MNKSEWNSRSPVAKPSPGAPVDGEAGDLGGVEEILNELLADAIPPEARVVRVLNAARRIVARLSPAPKQGREWWLVKWPSGSMEVREGRPTSGHAAFSTEVIHVREVEAGEGGKA